MFVDIVYLISFYPPNSLERYPTVTLLIITIHSWN